MKRSRFQQELIDLLIKHKQISPNHKRDEAIRESFRKHREKGMSAQSAIHKIAVEEVFLSDKTVNGIIYRASNYEIDTLGNPTKRIIIVKEI